MDETAHHFIVHMPPSRQSPLAAPNYREEEAVGESRSLVVFREQAAEYVNCGVADEGNMRIGSFGGRVLGLIVQIPGVEGFTDFLSQDIAVSVSNFQDATKLLVHEERPLVFHALIFNPCLALPVYFDNYILGQR